MDNSAIFYILDSDDDINYCTCKIIKKFYEEGKKILVSSKNSILIDDLNKLLWTFEQLSFIPHSTSKDYDSFTPVLLTETGYKNDSIIKKDYNIFINLDDEVKTDYHNYEIVIELVSGNEHQKNLAREKYLYYKNNRLNVKHENL
ncbi:MAG: DNA polymerase III subunit chi [Gammaproteobacteria bacterium]|nr:MAG: DNA polymerase III subunit chi [Gammaproteobacteria bacterium]